MTNPTSPQPRKLSPARSQRVAPKLAPRPVAPVPVVYRYTQQFRQEWQSGPVAATWGPRLVARLLELVLIGLPFNLLYNLIFLVVPESWLDLGLPPIGRDVIFWLVFALVTTLTALVWRASFGKRLLNLKVVRGSSPLPLALFFLREVLVIYSLVSLYAVVNFLLLSGLSQFTDFNLLYLPGAVFGLGSLPLFLNPPRPTLHDRVFKTQVVVADPQKILAN